MSRVLIVADANRAPALALSAAIAHVNSATDVKICGVADLDGGAIAHKDAMICALTLDVPSHLVFPAQDLFKFCRDVSAARVRVQQELQAETGEGDLWLPVVWTAKGPLYAEAIGAEAHQQSGELSYFQPLHLSDVWRQELYDLAYRLLTLLNAPPATYLMQFGLAGDRICFDRLWPFPAAPAIASVGVQLPDLFVCHWLCLTNMPIYDIQISCRSIKTVADFKKLV